MKKLSLLVTPLLALGLTATAASADHTHVLRHKDGSCTILAKNGGERFVVLPDSNPNVPAGTPENRKHPHHLYKHLKLNGNNQGSNVVGVFGVVDCSSYRNG